MCLPFHMVYVFAEAKCPLVFCREPEDERNHLKARMITTLMEDPATGSANGFQVGYLVKHRYWGELLTSSDTFITAAPITVPMTTAERVALQRAAEEDTYWLAETCSRAYAGHLDRGTYVPGNLSRVDNPKSHLKFMEYFDYYKITLDEFTVGGLMIAARGPTMVEVVNVFVDPDHQRKGVASAALRKADGLYPDAALWALGVPADDEVAASLVEAVGYVRVGQVVEDDGTTLGWYHRTGGPLSLTPVGSLREGMKNVLVEGVILEKAHARAVRGRRPGESLSVAEVGLGDESGRVVLTLWNHQIRMIQVGDRVRVENGFVGSYRGIIQLSAGRTGRIVKLGANPAV